MRTKFDLRPHEAELSWESHHLRYFRFAIDLMAELEVQCERVKAAWPIPHHEPLRDAHLNFPELGMMLDARNKNSDSVRIYAAMAVEGFMNWYGLLRLGTEVFNAQFERLGLVPKLQALLLVCDATLIEKSDPLLRALDEVAQSRNALVHPKAKEISPESVFTLRPKVIIPDAARDAVRSMRSFFTEFASAVPDAEPLLPKE